MATTWEPFDWYETPIYYDIVFDEDTVREADFVEVMLAEHGRSKRSGVPRVLEPACGTGRLCVELAERGWSVAGFDASAPMLDFARARLAGAGQEARLTHDRMESFRVRGTFDVAHCFVSTFKYLLSEDDARSHLECVARALRPGGIYVLGMHLSEYDVPGLSRERWEARRDGVHVVCTIQGWPPESRPRRERVRSRLVVSRAGAQRKFETEWWFRTYSARQLRKLLRSVPTLELVAVHDFEYDPEYEQELEGDQLDVVLVLRRR